MSDPIEEISRKYLWPKKPGIPLRTAKVCTALSFAAGFLIGVIL